MTCTTCGSTNPHVSIGYPVCPNEFHGHMHQPLWDTRNLVRGALIIVAGLLSLYATASLWAGFGTDFVVSAVLAILALGGVVLIDHLDAEHDRKIRRERDEVWARREAELDW